MRILPRREPLDSARRRIVQCAVIGLAILFNGSATAGGGTPLHVLLTNDDGFDAPGIVAMHRALLEAGYRVSVVAPREQQSGSSMRVSIGSIVVDKIKDDFWTVDGTPADSVSFALNRLLIADPPEIVISGANFGQNLGSNTNLSGTVGAAIMATQLGLPAIAISVGIDLGERDAQPVRFPSTMGAFGPAADFVVRLLRRIEDTRATTHRLLPPNKFLNVNYPAVPATRLKGVRIAQVARVGGFIPVFVDTDTKGKFDISLAAGAPAGDSIAMPDTALFTEGYITVSVLDGSLDAGQRSLTEIEDRLGDLRASMQTAPAR